jgi:regulator of replication initiation timing
MNPSREPDRAELHQAVVESLLTRIADLQGDIETLRETLHASVELNHALYGQVARLKICLQRNLWDVYNVVLDRESAA